MKVKLSYSVNLEDIPKEIERLYGEACEKLLDMTSRLEEINTRDAAQLDRKIGEVREALFEVDSRLEEVLGISGGYVNAMAAKMSHPPPSDSEDESSIDDREGDKINAGG
jgi:hypothetical protein